MQLGIPRFRDVVVQALGADKATRFFDTNPPPREEMEELSEELKQCYPDTVSSSPPIRVRYLDGTTEEVQVVLFEETGEHEALVIDQQCRAFRMCSNGSGLPTLEPYCVKHAIAHGVRCPSRYPTNH